MDVNCDEGVELLTLVEDYLCVLAELFRGEFKTPPHDIAAFVVGEFIERR